MSELDTIDPTPTPAPACCPWRTALQTPLLLIAAAGMGIAGQQVWSHRGDWRAAMSGGSGCSASADACASAAGGCFSEAASATAIEEEDTVSALAPENSSAQPSGEFQAL